MAEGKITISVMTSASKTYTIDVLLSSTVEEVKIILEKETGITPENQRLIYAGQVLSNEKTVGDYAIKDGHRMHLVARGKPATAANPGTSQPQPNTQTPSSPQTQPQTQPAPQFNPPMFGIGPGMGGPGMGGPGLGGLAGGFGMNPQQIAMLMQNPLLQQTMQQLVQNPQMFQQILAANPMAQQLFQNNPQMATMLQNPDIFRQLSNPQTIQAVLQMYNSMFPNMGGMGGGLGGAFGNPGQGQGQGQTQASSGTGSTQASSSTGTPGTTNPGAPNPFSGMNFDQLFQGLVPPPTGTPTTPPTAPMGVAPPPWGFGNMYPFQMPPVGVVPGVDPEQRFSVQLQQLQEMGFNNRPVNIQALQQTNGNVEAAVERILSGN